MPVICTAIRRSMTCLLLLLVVNVAPVTPLLAESGGVPINFIDLAMFRSSFFGNPEVLILDMEVELAGVAGVTGVNVTIGDGTTHPMTDDGDGVWLLDLNPSSLAQLISFSDGTWTVEIVGSTPSTSTFTVSTASLVEADLFPIPTGLSPAQDDIDVPANIIFSWNDPTGGGTPDLLAVCVFSTFDSSDMCDNSLVGTLNVTDTSWAPPAPMPPGLTEFEVFYADIDETRVGPLNVSSGVITWDNSPFVPLGYPASTPFFLLGSETIIEFDVASGSSVNVIELGMFRIDDLRFPEDFFLYLEIDLAGVPGVTGVNVTIGDGAIVALDQFGSNEWDVEVPANSLAELITRSDGLWTLEIFGTVPSTSTFTVSTASLVEADIFPSATGLSPAQGEVNVSPTAVISWNDPTGVITPDFLEVCITNSVEFLWNCDDSLLGLLSVTDTSWGNHPEMSPGLTDVEVI